MEAQNTTQQYKHTVKDCSSVISLSLVNTENTGPREMLCGFEYQLSLSVLNP